MGLTKDPNVDVTQFEEILFDEVFSDINTPGIWIAKTQEDLDNIKIIVLDGHSTLLEYNKMSQDLHWKAYNELGQYKYQPESISDGLVIFSHNFYFEFKMRIGTKGLLVSGSFDGNSIKNIIFPMKDTPLEQFFRRFTTRIEKAVIDELISSSEKAHLQAGKLRFPEATFMKIGKKLSILGINIKNELFIIKFIDSEIHDLTQYNHYMRAEMKIDSPTSYESDNLLNYIHIDQDFPETPYLSKLRTESKEKEIKKKGAKKKEIPSVSKMDYKEDVGLQRRSMASGAGAPSISERSSPTPAAPPPASKPKPVTPTADPVIMVKEIDEEDEVDDFVDSQEFELADDDLIATGMDKTESKLTLRYTHTSYFSRMLLNRAYPLVIKINTEEVGVKKSITSIVSGEKISEKEESVILDVQKTVTIRPEFPGCFVVPLEHEVELSDENIEVKFHVTPLALGSLDGSVRFLQAGKAVHSMHIETKVITHRLSRWLATIGASASVVPTMVAFMVNETPAQFMEKRMDNLVPSVGVNGLAILGLFTAFFLFLSGFVYRMQKPKKSSSSLAFPR